MTVYLDELTIAPTPELARLVAESLGLSGTLVPEQHRSDVLFSMLQDGDAVFIGPSGAEWWIGAAPGVSVTVVPDMVELDRRDRAETVLEWCLRRRGVKKGEARKLVQKAPTQRHGKYAVYVDASIEAQEHVQEQVKVAPVLTTIGPEEPARPFKWVCVEEAPQLVELLNALGTATESGQVVGLDIESDAKGKEEKGLPTVDPRKDELVGIGFAFDAEHTYYLPFNGRWDRDELIATLSPLLERLNWDGWNASYDALVSRRARLKLKPAVGDGQCGAMLLQHPIRDLKGTVYDLYGYRMQTYEETLLTFGVKKMSDVPPSNVAPYCCGDAWFGLKATQEYEERIRGDRFDSQRQLYYDIEMPVHAVLVRMSERGFPINLPKTLERAKEVRGEQDRVRDVLATQVGINNPGSRDQVAHYLFDTLGLPVQKLTTTQQPSVDDMVLLRLQKEAPLVISLLRQYRSLDKVRGTYLLPWLKEHRESRIYPLWKQYVTNTGRLSSADPNGMNIPPDLRDLVEGDLLVADYSQLEMRIAAWKAQVKALIDVFAADGDVHDETCRRVFGVGRKGRPELNVAAKSLNFAVMLYGAGAEKYIEMVEEQSLKNPHLAIKIPTIDEARGVLKEHEKAYPEWPVFKRYAIGLARQNGYAMDAYGRRWVLPDINSTDGKRRSAAEREVMSMAVQGTASTLVKMAMLKTDGLDTTGLLMLMQVHDELVWQWRGKEGDREEVRLAVQERMELGQPFVRGEWSDVRLKVEPKWVTNWKDAK